MEPRRDPLSKLAEIGCEGVAGVQESPEGDELTEEGLVLRYRTEETDAARSTTRSSPLSSS